MNLIKLILSHKCRTTEKPADQGATHRFMRAHLILAKFLIVPMLREKRIPFKKLLFHAHWLKNVWDFSDMAGIINSLQTVEFGCVTLKNVQNCWPVIKKQLVKKKKKKSNSLTFHWRILFHMKYPQYTAVTINQVSRKESLTSEKRDGEYVNGGTRCFFSLSCCQSPMLSRHHSQKEKWSLRLWQKRKKEKSSCHPSHDRSLQLRLCYL